MFTTIWPSIVGGYPDCRERPAKGLFRFRNQNRQGRPATVAGVQGVAMRNVSRLQSLAAAAEGGGIAWTTPLMLRTPASALGACAATQTSQHAQQQTDGGHSWRTKLAAAGAAAAFGLAAALASGTLVVHGDASRAAPTSAGPATGEQLTQLHEWLTAQGADVSRVQVCASQAGWRHLTRARPRTPVKARRNAMLIRTHAYQALPNPDAIMTNNCVAGPKWNLS